MSFGQSFYMSRSRVESSPDACDVGRSCICGNADRGNAICEHEVFRVIRIELLYSTAPSFGCLLTFRSISDG